MKTLATLLAIAAVSAAALAADNCPHRRLRLRRARAGQLHAAGHQARGRRRVARLHRKTRPPRRTHARTHHGDEFHLHPLRRRESVSLCHRRADAASPRERGRRRAREGTAPREHELRPGERHARTHGRLFGARRRAPDRRAVALRHRRVRRAELQPILDAYGQAVDKKKNPLDPTGPLNHTLRVFLIDRDGQHPQHLQLRHARPAPRARRRANADDGVGANHSETTCAPSALADLKTNAPPLTPPRQIGSLSDKSLVIAISERKPLCHYD